jgi:hypothetical protein
MSLSVYLPIFTGFEDVCHIIFSNYSINTIIRVYFNNILEVIAVNDDGLKVAIRNNLNKYMLNKVSTENFDDFYSQMLSIRDHL